LNASPIRPSRCVDMPTNSGAANGNPCAHEMALQQAAVKARAALAMRCSLIVLLLDLLRLGKL
jgi:hypothetical protein